MTRWNSSYEKYGYYAEKTHNLVMPGLDGLQDMAKLMKDLRDNPPAEIAGVKVGHRKDYTDGTVVDCATGAKSRHGALRLQRAALRAGRRHQSFWSVPPARSPRSRSIF